ncbi:WD repeat domain 74 lethal (2) k09848 [Tachypleus tridentatus]|uniref:WD repeat domain 74 lethal (2) k09848 n=1 Tax=Tachypleus tridentatus TaxID=6853 RepID=UPI003FD2134F
MTEKSERFDMFIGCETGYFKGVNTIKKKSCNLNKLDSLRKEDEIVFTCWNNEEETEVCLGLRRQSVKIFSVDRLCFIDEVDISGGRGPPRGLAKSGGNLVTCVESGLVSVWNVNHTKTAEFEVGNNICRMRQSPFKPSILATGGKENHLKLWDVQNPEKPVFVAKNVRPDFLDLRVPVWVLDIQFLPGTEKVVVGTGTHAIHIYDPLTPQRRPVLTVEFDEYPVTALAVPHSANNVVAGNTRGRMALIDLRKKSLAHVYRGVAGSIRCITCHQLKPIVASCGLDRFVRVHDLNSHYLQLKMYLKSRLNCLLMKTDDNIFEDSKNNSSDTDEMSDEDFDQESDSLWLNMENVGDEENNKQESHVKHALPYGEEKNLKRLRYGNTETKSQFKRKR